MKSWSSRARGRSGSRRVIRNKKAANGSCRRFLTACTVFGTCCLLYIIMGTMITTSGRDVVPIKFAEVQAHGFRNASGAGMHRGL